MAALILAEPPRHIRIQVELRLLVGIACPANMRARGRMLPENKTRNALAGVGNTHIRGGGRV